MDRLHTGAIAVDAAGVVRAANRPASDYLALTSDPRGTSLRETLASAGLEEVGPMVEALLERGDGQFEEVELAAGPSDGEAMPDKVRELKRKLHDWRESVGAQMPTPNPDGDPAKYREYKERRLWKPVDIYQQQTAHSKP